MKLRDSQRAEKWLLQFDVGDRSTAALLIDSLVLVDSATFNQGLQHEIESRLSQLGVGELVGLYASREMSHRSNVSAAASATATANKQAKRRQSYTPDSSYFDLTDPTITPDAAPGPAVGSEGYVAHLLRDIAQALPSRRVFSHPSIAQLRQQRFRRAFLVDDIIGSGKRSYGFAEAFCNHPTIRSWISGRHFRVEVLAFCGTENGIAKVKAHRFVESVNVVQAIPSGCASWTRAEQASVESLCQKYAPRTSHPRWGLGFRESFTLQVFQHDVSNGTPPILWSGSDSWSPLLTKRPDASHRTWPMPEDVQTRRKRILEQIPSLRHSISPRLDRHLEPGGFVRLVLLAAVAKRVRRIELLSSAAEVSICEARKIVSDCIQFGWLSPGITLTELGRAELQYATRLGLARLERPPLKGLPYYPTSLRNQRLV